MEVIKTFKHKGKEYRIISDIEYNEHCDFVCANLIQEYIRVQILRKYLCIKYWSNLKSYNTCNDSRTKIIQITNAKKWVKYHILNK